MLSNDIKYVEIKLDFYIGKATIIRYNIYGNIEVIIIYSQFKINIFLRKSENI